MEVPEGLTVEKVAKDSVVCKLNKSRYGLKQAPRCWNKKFLKFLNQFKFECSDADQCIFVLQARRECVFSTPGLTARAGYLAINFDSASSGLAVGDRDRRIKKMGGGVKLREE